MIVKSEAQLSMEPLAQSKVPKEQLPRGGKAFEQEEFSTGVLLLPPLGRKQRELASTVEVSY